MELYPDCIFDPVCAASGSGGMEAKMYKIIIADDEEIMREGLISLVDWNAMGFEITGQFEDGEEAMRYLDENPVDVLLTDIKMTFVSGIDLAKYVYERKMPVKIVFISGYKEFEYARQAMKYNVVQYLLKPISLNDIHNVFETIRKELDQERESAKARNDRKKKYDGLLSYIREQFFTDLVLGALQNPEEIRKRWKVLDFHVDPSECHCCIWNVSVVDCEKYISENWDYGKDAFQKAIQNVLCISKDDLYLQIIANHGEKFRIWMNDSDGCSKDAFRQLTEEHMDRAVCNAEKLLGIQLTAESEQYFDNLFALPADRISSDSGLPILAKIFTDTEQLSDQQKLLMAHIRDGNRESAFSLADQILRQSVSLGLQKSKMLFSDLFTRITSQMKKNGISFPEERNPDRIANALSGLNSNEEIRNFIFSLLDACLQLSKKDEEKSDSVVIQHIKDYIRNHYDHDITLDDVSDQVFLNPIYISRLFKHKTGENFSDYLVRVRMENAGELLKDPRYKVYEVGYQVGYQSTKYFYRIFKQYYGCTPTEYRRKSGWKGGDDIGHEV